MQDFLDFFFFNLFNPRRNSVSTSIPFWPKQKVQCRGLDPGKGDMQVRDHVLHENRCIRQEQGALVRPVEMATSIGMSVPPAAWVCLSKAWGTAGHTGLSSEPGMRGQGWHHAGLCTAVPLSGAKPTLPFPPQPPKPV